MTTTITITICILILIAYSFDLSSRKTKIPTVVLLLVLGWLVAQLSTFFKIQLPPLKPLLPALGNIGLILIVLEGGLELELNKSKKEVIKKSSLSALTPIIILTLAVGYGFSYYSGQSYLIGIVNAIPLCVISSAIAIPSVKNISQNKKEFIIYESSLSDIFGVIIFNFFVTSEAINFMAVGNFLFQIVLIVIISLFSSVGLAYLIKRIDHHVKFIPIITIMILLYTIAKIYHLPSLVLILIFGVLLNNLDQLKEFYIIKRFEITHLDSEVHRFREIVIEIAFVVRTMFFLLFGFVIDAPSLLNSEGLIIAGIIVASIFIVRLIYFKIKKIDVFPLLFIAPRGLITILLFLSIPAAKKLDFVNESLMTQVVLLSALVMMVGLMFSPTDAKKQHL